MEQSNRTKQYYINFVPILFLFLSLVLHAGWMFYTKYIEEDAFITFRIARQIAFGNGFTFNSGEPLYASTTPLLTLLLSVWIRLISTDVVLGARLINLLAVALTLIFSLLILRSQKRTPAEQIGALTVGMFSVRLIYMETQGMEMPLGLALLAASLYFWGKGRAALTGILCGLLLWVRIDFIFWVLILSVFTAINNWKDSLRVAGMAFLVYLPWVLFASVYFGSPIPFTVTAKWVAYTQFDLSPYLLHLRDILEYLSPFRADGFAEFLGTGIAALLIVAALWGRRFADQKMFILLIVFVLFEIVRLTFTRTTYFSRYFVPMAWIVLLLSGVGLGDLWNVFRSRKLYRLIFQVFAAGLIALQVHSGIVFAQEVRDRQMYRHDGALKAMGLWLKENTDPASIVLLEPLGYVGYYSERTMLDEVGLVTPAIVELKRQRIGAEQYAEIFQPDYLIVHCDDTIRIPLPSETRPHYELTVTFDPLEYKRLSLNSSDLPWLSCYEIWAKQ